MTTYRSVFVISTVALLMSLVLGVLVWDKPNETVFTWAQQSLLWTGLLGITVGNVLRSQEKRIVKLEKQASNSDSV